MEAKFLRKKRKNSLSIYDNILLALFDACVKNEEIVFQSRFDFLRFVIEAAGLSYTTQNLNYHLKNMVLDNLINENNLEEGYVKYSLTEKSMEIVKNLSKTSSFPSETEEEKAYKDLITEEIEEYESRLAEKENNFSEKLSEINEKLTESINLIYELTNRVNAMEHSHEIIFEELRDVRSKISELSLGVISEKLDRILEQQERSEKTRKKLKKYLEGGKSDE